MHSTRAPPPTSRLPKPHLTMSILLLFLLLLPVHLAMPPGLTLDSCRADNACVPPRLCRAGFIDEWKPCSPTSDNCVCLPDKPQICDVASECPSGEVCAVFTNAFPLENFCASSDAVDQFSTLVTPDDLSPLRSPDPEQVPASQTQLGDPMEAPEIPPSICVDARVLRDSAVPVVYQNHFTAKVLCDLHGSCATASHVVLWGGSPMMMRTYCESVRCEEAVLKVNSPAYRRKVRIPSRTEGLEFTAFAARYETRAEELAIRVAVKLGL